MVSQRMLIKRLILCFDEIMLMLIRKSHHTNVPHVMNCSNNIQLSTEWIEELKPISLEFIGYDIRAEFSLSIRSTNKIKRLRHLFKYQNNILPVLYKMLVQIQ